MSFLKEVINELHPGKRSSMSKIIQQMLFNQTFKFLLNHRIGNKLVKSRNKFLVLLSRFLKNRQLYKWGCDIKYQVVIGKGVKFWHPTGVVIGHGTVIGDYVQIWQNVTIGEHGKPDAPKMYPFIKNGARIYSGAVIMGGITIGENAIIGANAVVNIDVPDNCIAVGVPCRIISPDSNLKTKPSSV